MGSILVGIVLGLLVVFICLCADISEHLAATIATFIVFAGILCGLLVNTGGYQPVKEIQTYKLENLADQTTSVGGGSIFYVSVGAKNVFTFYTQVDSEFKSDGSKAYTSKTVSGNVTVIEEEECENPRMVEYRQDSIATFWSFAVFDGSTSYVFYVPKGTIIHEFALGQ